MQRLRSILSVWVRHRAFIPIVVACIALALGVLLSMEHTRNILKIRGPYLLVLAAIIVFPVFAFRFFDPQENARPISIFFVLSALYYIYMGAPDAVAFFRLFLFERMPPGTTRNLLYGVAAYFSLAGILHYILKVEREEDEKLRILDVSIIKFLVYAILHIVYINLFVTIAREKFGISTVFL
ncbi:MAG: hypothetical protein LDLANPLL_00218 [Turneriella sp.]|nr:hypothetical protein [Turneriella sp.]